MSVKQYEPYFSKTAVCSAEGDGHEHERNRAAEAVSHQDRVAADDVVRASGEGGQMEGGEEGHPGIVHRLDRDTSGLLVVARTEEAYERLRGLVAEDGPHRGRGRSQRRRRKREGG